MSRLLLTLAALCALYAVPAVAQVQGRLDANGCGTLAAGSHGSPGQYPEQIDANGHPCVDAQQPDVQNTGTINSATSNAAYTISLLNGEAVVGFKVSGLTASGATLTLEGSNDGGTTWSAINELISGSGATASIGATLTADGQFGVNGGGRTGLRLRVSTPGTGTITVASNASAASSRVTLQTSLPPGQSGVGNVGGKTVAVCTTPTVTASNAYGTNYVVGGKLTFSNAFTSTGSGILQGVVVTILDNETSGFTFFPFNANPSNTTWTDAAVAAIAAGDVPAVRAPVQLTGNNQLKSTVFSVYSAVGLGEALAPGATTLYGVLIANAALTNDFAGTSDVQVCVKILDDE